MIFGPAGAVRSQAQQDHQAFVEEAKGSGKHDFEIHARGAGLTEALCGDFSNACFLSASLAP